MGDLGNFLQDNGPIIILVALSAIVVVVLLSLFANRHFRKIRRRLRDKDR